MIAITQCRTITGVGLGEFAQTGTHTARNRPSVRKPRKNSPYLNGGVDDEFSTLFDAEPLYAPVPMRALKAELLKAFTTISAVRASGNIPTDSKYAGSDGWMNWRQAARFLPCSVSDAPLSPRPDRKHDLEAYWAVEDALKALVRSRKLATAFSPVYRIYKTDDERDLVEQVFYEDELLFALAGTPRREIA